MRNFASNEWKFERSQCVGVDSRHMQWRTSQCSGSSLACPHGQRTGPGLSFHGPSMPLMPHDICFVRSLAPRRFHPHAWLTPACVADSQGGLSSSRHQRLWSERESCVCVCMHTIVGGLVRNFATTTITTTTTATTTHTNT